MTQAVVTASPTTAVTPPSHAPEPPPRALARLRSDAPVGLVLLACAWWLLVAPRLEGGRGVGAVTAGAILTGLATLAIRPQQVVPARAVGLALLVSAAALGVAVVAPTGWAGASTAASYVCVSWTVIAVAAAVIRQPSVVNLVLSVAVGGVLIEVAESWLAWWGGASASLPMFGTFYWYNPFAVFLLAGTVIGLSQWLLRSGLFAWFGLLGAVLGTVGIVYSTSRATGACFAVAVGLVAVSQLFTRGLAGARRLLIGLAVVAFAVWAVGGPPFFPHRSLPFAATSARTAGQSLGQNGGYRLDFWREAIGVFRRHLLTGGGYHSLAVAAAGHVPASWPLSPLAHDGYLQALSDGGLLLGVPFLLATAAIAWYVLAGLASAVRTHDFSTAAFVVPLCLGALLAHSVIDFDWSYAADFEVVAILAGLVAAARWSRTEPAEDRAESQPGRTRAAAIAVVVGVALTGIAAGSSWHGDFRQSLPLGHTSNSGGSA